MKRRRLLRVELRLVLHTPRALRTARIQFTRSKRHHPLSLLGSGPSIVVVVSLQQCCPWCGVLGVQSDYFCVGEARFRNICKVCPFVRKMCLSVRVGVFVITKGISKRSGSTDDADGQTPHNSLGLHLHQTHTSAANLL